MIKLKDTFIDEKGKQHVQRFSKIMENGKYGNWYFCSWNYEHCSVEELLAEGWVIKKKWIISPKRKEFDWINRYAIEEM